MEDPKTHRTILTKDGVQTIPRTQQGTKFEDFFQNARLPEDPRRMVVYATETGPVLGDPEPVPWSAEHDRRQSEAVEKVRQAIETEGRYVPTLRAQSSALARETGMAPNEVRDRIIGEFTAKHGKDIRTYLEDQREAQGLPTRRTAPGYGQCQGPTQDLEP